MEAKFSRKWLKMAENAPPGVPLILAGGLTPDNVTQGIQKVKPWGVDVSSGVERSPGVKDPILVRAFVQTAKKAGRELQELKDNKVNDEEPYDWEEDSTWR